MFLLTICQEFWIQDHAEVRAVRADVPHVSVEIAVEISRDVKLYLH